MTSGCFEQRGQHVDEDIRADQTRQPIVRMKPPSIPWPRAMVYFTGVCEIAGAVGRYFLNAAVPPPMR